MSFTTIYLRKYGILICQICSNVWRSLYRVAYFARMQRPNKTLRSAGSSFQLALVSGNQQKAPWKFTKTGFWRIWAQRTFCLPPGVVSFRFALRVPFERLRFMQQAALLCMLFADATRHRCLSCPSSAFIHSVVTHQGLSCFSTACLAATEKQSQPLPAGECIFGVWCRVTNQAHSFCQFSWNISDDEAANSNPCMPMLWCIRKDNPPTTGLLAVTPTRIVAMQEMNSYKQHIAEYLLAWKNQDHRTWPTASASASLVLKPQAYYQLAPHRKKTFRYSPASKSNLTAQVRPLPDPISCDICFLLFTWVGPAVFSVR